MSINGIVEFRTGVGRGWSGKKIWVDADSRRLILTIFKPVNYAGGCEWHGVSLTPGQAIAVANCLRNPLPDEWEDYAKPAPPPAPQGRMSEVWQIYAVKHSNGVHRALLGIKKNTVAMYNSHRELARSGKSTYFYYKHCENLTDAETTRLAGLLYYWAGSRMIGTKSVAERTKRRMLKVANEDK